MNHFKQLTQRATHPILVALLLAIALAGCASLQPTGKSETPRLAVQYATLKVIEQAKDVTAAGVVEHVQRVRDVVNGNVELPLARLVEEVRGPIDWDALSTSDRLLLDALIAQIEHAILEVEGPGGDGLIGEERRVRLLTLLDWVEQAAGYAG